LKVIGRRLDAHVLGCEGRQMTSDARVMPRALRSPSRACSLRSSLVATLDRVLGPGGWLVMARSWNSARERARLARCIREPGGQLWWRTEPAWIRSASQRESSSSSARGGAVGERRRAPARRSHCRHEPRAPERDPQQEPPGPRPARAATRAPRDVALDLAAHRGTQVAALGRKDLTDLLRILAKRAPELPARSPSASPRAGRGTMHPGPRSRTP